MKYLPYLPAVAGLVLLFLASQDPQGADSPEAALGAMLLGVGAALSGLRALSSGEILVRSRTARRDERPGAFWFTVVVTRFAVAAVLIGAGAWMLLG